MNKKPIKVLIVGPQGSGKTTLAVALADILIKVDPALLVIDGGDTERERAKPSQIEIITKQRATTREVWASSVFIDLGELPRRIISLGAFHADVRAEIRKAVEGQFLWVNRRKPFTEKEKVEGSPVALAEALKNAAEQGEVRLKKEAKTKYLKEAIKYLKEANQCLNEVSSEMSKDAEELRQFSESGRLPREFESEEEGKLKANRALAEAIRKQEESAKRFGGGRNKQPKSKGCHIGVFTFFRVIFLAATGVTWAGTLATAPKDGDGFITWLLLTFFFAMIYNLIPRD